MSIFTDTSAFYAVFDADDQQNERAVRYWASAMGNNAPLVTTSYVLLETCALVQRRLGVDVLRKFCEEVVPVLTIEWVGQDLHDAAVIALLAAGRRNLSLVDCVSFAVMRRDGIRDCFAFDPHFDEQGFNRFPAL